MTKCEHNKYKNICKICSPNLYCIHEKRKSCCKICGGSYLCIHSIQKHTCRECSPKSFCEHGKNKIRCKECGGSGICEHNKIKSACKECGGSQICEHNKFKRLCKECDGLGLCEHKINKSHCKECNGSGICEHNKQKSQCKECGGSGICIHNKYKSACKECKGSSYCEHQKLKRLCRICDGSLLCKSIWCEKYGVKKYNGYCLLCCINLFPEIEVSRNYKTKENNVVTNITTSFTNFTWISDKKIQDGCSKRRPDLLLDLGSRIIIIEVDENKHSTYDCICENKRLMEISQDLGHRPIIFIRFNPDSYIENGIKISSCWKTSVKGLTLVPKCKENEWFKRIETLKLQIQYWIDNENEKTIEIIELFY